MVERAAGEDVGRGRQQRDDRSLAIRVVRSAAAAGQGEEAPGIGTASAQPAKDIAEANVYVCFGSRGHSLRRQDVRLLIAPPLPDASLVCACLRDNGPLGSLTR